MIRELFYSHYRSDNDNTNTLKVMTIGNNNVFEVDCLVESRTIGDNNVVESKGLKKNCILS